MTALIEPKRKRRRKAKREWSPTYFDENQYDLIEFIADKNKREAFANLDQAIERALRKSGR